MGTKKFTPQTNTPPAPSAAGGASPDVLEDRIGPQTEAPTPSAVGDQLEHGAASANKLRNPPPPPVTPQRAGTRGAPR